MDHPNLTEGIPTLDIATYLKGEPGAREAVAAKLREISKTVGFFYLKGHGIPQEPDRRRVRTVGGGFMLCRSRPRRQFLISPPTASSPAISRATDDYQRTNINILEDAKPNLIAKFSINREGGSGGLSMTEQQRRVRVNMWPENLPASKKHCRTITRGSKSSDDNFFRCGRRHSSCHSTISTSTSPRRT